MTKKGKIVASLLSIFITLEILANPVNIYSSISSNEDGSEISRQHEADSTTNKSELTNKTDRVIGRYWDAKEKQFAYKSVAVDDIEYHGNILTAHPAVTFTYKDGSSKTQRLEYVQPDYIRQTYETASSEAMKSWGSTRIGADKFKQQLAGRKGTVIVAVLDTGIDTDHPFLRDRLVPGYNFTDNDTCTDDLNSHGTHVAGIIKDCTPQNVKLMPVKVIDDGGIGYDSNIAKGIYFAVDNGAAIINMSLGGVGYSVYMDKAIDYALGKGVLVVAAAGNDKNDVKYYFPAQKDDVLVVSATNEEDTLADFSNYGATVDVSAPGCNINSSVPDGRYANYSGTSMATPFVSAAAALIKLDDMKRNSDDIEYLIKTNATDLGSPGRDDAFGEGMVNVGSLFDKTLEFGLVSPKQDSSWVNYISVKYVINGHINDKLEFFVGNKLLKKVDIDKEGFDNTVLSLEGITKGDYTLRIVLLSNNITVKSEEVKIKIQESNIVIKLFDIENKPVQYYDLYIYGLTGDSSEVITPEVNKLEVGIGATYMFLDMDSLRKKYTEIVAVATNSYDLMVPVYIRKLVTTGEIYFKPDNLQAVSFSQNISELKDMKGVGSAVIYPSVDNTFLGEGLGSTKVIFFGEDSTVYVDKGIHKVSFGAFGYFHFSILKGNGETEIILDDSNTIRLDIKGDADLGQYGSGKWNTFNVISCGNKFFNCSGFILNPGDNIIYISPGCYRLGFSVYKYNYAYMDFYKDVIIDKKSKPVTFEHGGTLKDEFIVDYSSGRLNGILKITDSFNNTLVTTSITDRGLYITTQLQNLNDSEVQDLWNNSKIVLENKKTHEKFTTKMTNNFDFEKQGIPDGDYHMYVDFRSNLVPTDFKGKDVTIKSEAFYLTAKQNSPISLFNEKKINVKPYNIFTLDLKSIFKDKDGDKLYYNTNLGFISKDTLYFETGITGTYGIELSASDYKDGTANAKIELVVSDGSIIYDPTPTPTLTPEPTATPTPTPIMVPTQAPTPIPGHIPSTVPNKANISNWAVDSVQRNWDNQMADVSFFGNYKANNTREEFAMLAVRFYEKATGNMAKEADNSMFSDISGSSYKSDILKANQLHIVNGTGNGKFNPKGQITRQEIAVMLYNMLKATIPGDYSVINDIKFKDANKIANWARDAVMYLYKNNLMKGTAELTISPLSNATREMAMVLIDRIAITNGVIPQ